MNKRIIIYGDIQGCLEEFQELRAKVNIQGNDFEIIVGDILDKGPYSIKLLNYIQDTKIQSVMGNHEYKYVRFKRHQNNFKKTGKKNPIELNDEQLCIFNRLSDDNLTFLDSLPLFIKIDNLTILHAGITNKISLEKSKKHDIEKILWIRNLNHNENPISIFDDQKNTKFWSEYYNGHQGFVVYGHSAFEEVKVDKYSLGIDTGCVTGNKLTACIISDTINPKDNYQIIQVQAKRKYQDAFIE